MRWHNWLNDLIMRSLQAYWRLIFAASKCATASVFKTGNRDDRAAFFERLPHIFRNLYGLFEAALEVVSGKGAMEISRA
jgi:hypothetical protein